MQSQYILYRYVYKLLDINNYSYTDQYRACQYIDAVHAESYSYGYPKSMSMTSLFLHKSEAKLRMSVNNKDII